MNNSLSNDPFSSPTPKWDAPSSGSYTNNYVPCENGVRFGAYLLDALLAVVTLGIGWFIWSIFLWPKSTSPGKKMLGLIVIDTKTGAPCSTGTMALRELVGKTLLSSFTCGITTLVGGIMILASDKRQGIWDQIASTTVVKAQ